MALEEVHLVKDVIHQSMLHTRQKLAPFLNQGFNYKDRRETNAVSTFDAELTKRRNISFMQNRELIERFRKILEEAISTKNAYLVEKTLF